MTDLDKQAAARLVVHLVFIIGVVALYLIDSKIKIRLPVWWFCAWFLIAYLVGRRKH